MSSSVGILRVCWVFIVVIASRIGGEREDFRGF